MIEVVRGDILGTHAEAVVNTVNCVGIMGRGIALQFKKMFPDNFAAYKAACDVGDVQPGKMFVFKRDRLTAPRLIINFPTKRHWKGKSRITDIELGLRALVMAIKQHGITSIAIPPLGCGLGGLDWDDVRPMIEAAMAELPGLRAILFEPGAAPDAAAMAHTKMAPPMTPGRAALLGLMDRYLSGLMDPFVSLLEAHKLMFFMQEAGEPLKLRYRAWTYGPYAENLKHVLNTIEGHYIHGYLDGGDTPEKELELVPGAVQDAMAYLIDSPATLDRFERVAKLVNGFETPYGLELLATVQWIATRERADTLDQVVEGVHGWNERKQQFTRQQIAIALSTLREQGWCKSTAPEVSAVST